MTAQSASDPNLLYQSAQSQMALLPNYYEWTYGIFRPWLVGDVVELGCGAGLGIRTYLKRVQRVYAVDHDSELLRRLADALPGERVHPVEADLLDSWSELDGISADTVVMMDVLEHFADDHGFLTKARNLLKPGGRLCIKVPAQRRMFSEMDEASGHYRRYDPEDIEALAAELDLRPLRIRYINQVGGLAYHLKRRRKTNFSRTFSLGQLKTINLLLPLIAATDRIQVLPGLSLIAVLETPV